MPRYKGVDMHAGDSGKSAATRQNCGGAFPIAVRDYRFSVA